MKFGLLLLLFCVFYVSADINSSRIKRQASGYTFPGPRRQRQTSSDEYYNRKPQYEELIDQYDQPATRSSPQSYNPSSQQGYSGQPYNSQPAGPSYSQPQPSSGSQPSYRPRAQTQTYPKQTVATYGVNPNAKADAEALAKEEEDNKKPDRLQLLLAESKFSCSEKKDGYYADDTVGCQVFHYCVSGAKHSWQCPEGTVFHQVHLNCVPASQDICQQSAKFYVVNDYLYKPLEQRGPNNTILYHQRYYPEEYAVNDPLLNPLLANQLGTQSFGYGSSDSDSGSSYAGSSYGSSGRAQPQPQPQSQPSYSSAPAPRPRIIYKPQTSRQAATAYNQPEPYSSLTQPPVTPTRKPTYALSPSYSSSGASGPSSYPSPSYSGPSSGANYRSSNYPTGPNYESDANYPASSGSSGYSSGGSGYSGASSGYPASASSYPSPSSSGYSPSAPSGSSYSAPTSSGYSAPSGSGYSAPSSAGYSAPSSAGYSSPSSYPSSAPSASAYTPYRPQSPKPSYPTSYGSYQNSNSYPSGYRVANSGSGYGGSPSGSSLRGSGYAPLSRLYPAEITSGVKYDEE